MQRIQRATVVLLGALALAACGPQQVGSRYVKSQEVRASEGGLLSISSAESPELAGARLEIPAGALTSNTTLTVELGLGSILGRELAAGPVAIFGPLDTVLSKDVVLTLPVLGLASTDDVSIVAEAADGSTYEVDPGQVALNASRTLATFRIRHLGTFQPRRRTACRSDVECAAGLACVRGRCRGSQGGNDGGPSCQMSCPAGTTCDPSQQVCVMQPTGCATNRDCPANFACTNGRCELPSQPTCGMTTCASGQYCVRGQCVMEDGDGGTSNPLACMADADCGPELFCVQGYCQRVCVPSSEACNNLDDNCNGLIDEGCNNPNDGGIFCGGFAGIRCPQSMTCVDDPTDRCDPSTGADCAGICVDDLDGGGVDAGPFDGGPFDPDAGIACTSMGGFGGRCPPSMTCVEETCDPSGACTGHCVEDFDGGTPDGGDIDAGPAQCRNNLDCVRGQACIQGLCQ